MNQSASGDRLRTEAEDTSKAVKPEVSCLYICLHMSFSLLPISIKTFSLGFVQLLVRIDSFLLSDLCAYWYTQKCLLAHIRRQRSLICTKGTTRITISFPSTCFLQTENKGMKVAELQQCV